MLNHSSREPKVIDGKAITVKGRLFRTAKLQDEHYVPLEQPLEFIKRLAASRFKADIFTFVQEIQDRASDYGFYKERDALAILPLTTYDHWFNNQINFKPRNKIRKAKKSGVEVRPLDLNDALVRGIMEIFNESPVRQGKRNWHYGKEFETVRRELGTFMEQSEFLGAFYKEELIGFVKVTHCKHYSILMHILAKIAHRDKAPTNALIARTIEVCAERHVPYLVFSFYGRRRGLNDLREANGFERVEIPRYYVPLTLKGRLILKFKLHRAIRDYFPDWLVAWAGDLRGKWIQFLYRKQVSEKNDRLRRDVKPRREESSLDGRPQTPALASESSVTDPLPANSRHVNGCPPDDSIARGRECGTG